MFNTVFARKINGQLAFYMDYQALNNNTVKNYYPLPLINKTLGLTAGAT